MKHVFGTGQHRNEQSPESAVLPGIATPAVGWASLTFRVSDHGPGNAPVFRGVAVEGHRLSFDRKPIAADGSFRFDDASAAGAWLKIELPGRPPELRGPFDLAPGSQTTLDVPLTPPATARGRLVDVPPTHRGLLWIVVIDRAAFTTTFRSERDDSFELVLPPGHYALRVGSESLRSSSNVMDGPAAPLVEFDLQAGQSLDLGALRVPPFERGELADRTTR